MAIVNGLLVGEIIFLTCTIITEKDTDKQKNLVIALISYLVFAFAINLIT